MIEMRSLAFVFVLAILAMASPRPAEACRCTDVSFASARTRSAAIFIGTVVAIERAASAGTHDRYTFEVETVFKGNPDKQVTVRSGTHSCGWRNLSTTRKEGARLLVYAVERDGVLHVQQCDRSSPAGSAQARRDIKALRS
jgi:hypothetical protein